MSNYLLYDINNIELKKISDKEKRKLLKRGNIVSNLFNMVYVYELWQNGKRYYFIYDKYYNIIRLIRDKKGIIIRLPYDVFQQIFNQLRDMLVVRGNSFNIEKDYGVVIFIEYENINENVIEYENITIRREFKDVKVYGKPFPLEVDVLYIDNKAYAIGIPWEEFIDLIHMVLLLFLSFKESF